METKELPEVVKIKSTEELKVGMVMVYTGQPRGTGAWPPEIGATAELKDRSDVIGISIEIIERGRGWWPTKESYDKLK